MLFFSSLLNNYVALLSSPFSLSLPLSCSISSVYAYSRLVSIFSLCISSYWPSFAAVGPRWAPSCSYFLDLSILASDFKLFCCFCFLILFRSFFLLLPFDILTVLFFIFLFFVFCITLVYHIEYNIYLYIYTIYYI